MIRNIVVGVMLVLSFSLPAAARFKMLSAAETVSYADLIAVVDVATPSQTPTTDTGNSRFAQRAEAKVERILKGPSVKSITILGDVSDVNGNKLCVPDIHLSAGKHLVFLRKIPAGYVTAGGGITFSEIKDGKVSWYSDAKSDQYKSSLRPVQAVIQDVESLLKQ